VGNTVLVQVQSGAPLESISDGGAFFMPAYKSVKVFSRSVRF
jgi:hypothetical protein